MRNIFSLISRFHAVLLFLVLQIICFSLIFSFNNYHKSSYLNSSNAIAGSLFEFRTYFTEPFEVKEINDQLQKENEVLHNTQITSFRKIDTDIIEINDTVFKQQYFYYAGSVINTTYREKYNYLTLNVGSSNGIEKGMGVTSPEGIVGLVKDVSSNYSVVMPIMHPLFVTDVKIKSKDYFGNLNWVQDELNYAYIKGISNTSEVTEGDTVLTRGSSARFPSNLNVGVVSSVETVPGQDAFEIKVKLFTDFTKIHKVYVIKNVLRDEQLELEKKMKEEEEERNG